MCMKDIKECKKCLLKKKKKINLKNEKIRPLLKYDDEELLTLKNLWSGPCIEPIDHEPKVNLCCLELT